MKFARGFSRQHRIIHFTTIEASIQRGGEEWEVIELPAILPSGNPLWPQFWPLEELNALKDELPIHKWNAQYMQAPTGAEGALVKREWWQMWEHENPPKCDYIIQSWDTAFSKTNRSDFSACVTLGIFLPEDSPNPQIILLDAFQERLEFPELKEKAMELYKEYTPECCIIEAKAAGAPLIYELRSMGIPASPRRSTPGATCSPRPWTPTSPRCTTASTR